MSGQLQSYTEALKGVRARLGGDAAQRTGGVTLSAHPSVAFGSPQSTVVCVNPTQVYVNPGVCEPYPGVCELYPGVC